MALPLTLESHQLRNSRPPRVIYSASEVNTAESNAPGCAFVVRVMLLDVRVAGTKQGDSVAAQQFTITH